MLFFYDNESKEVIILGDIDCDLTKKAVLDNNARHIPSMYELFCLKKLIEEPTRVTMDTSTLIDHIATTYLKSILISGVHKFSASDHYMIYCVRKLNGAIQNDHETLKTRNMKRFTEDHFLADVSSIQWWYIFPDW